MKFEKRVVVVAHGDCDGLCSTAIVLREYPQADVIFSQPYALKPVLYWREIEEADMVVILDLAFHHECLQRLIELDKEKELVYIDHHLSSLELIGKLTNAFIDTTFSTSQLTSIYFRVPSIFGEIGAVCDKILKLSKRCKLFREAELLRRSLTYQPNDDEFRRCVVHAMSFDKLPSQIPEVVRRAQESVKLKDELVQLAQSRIIHNSKFLLIDVTDLPEFGGRVGVVATEITLKYKKPVFIISKSGDKFIITGRCLGECDFDLNELMKTFGGGGHKHAASASITEEQYRQIVKLLTDAFRR